MSYDAREPIKVNRPRRNWALNTKNLSIDLACERQEKVKKRREKSGRERMEKLSHVSPTQLSRGIPLSALNLDMHCISRWD